MPRISTERPSDPPGVLLRDTPLGLGLNPLDTPAPAPVKEEADAPAS